MQFHPSELILNKDGSIFHLALRPEEIADLVLLVGDPGRVARVSAHFDRIEVQRNNREFITHTGQIGDRRVSVISTGIGTDNIDIVMNEMDALVNIDLAKREPKEKKRILSLIRMGTCGSLQPDIPAGSLILSRYAVGFDGTLNYYAARNDVADLDLEQHLCTHLHWNPILPAPAVVRSSDRLHALLEEGSHSGLTISAPGFYGPQGRSLRLRPLDPAMNNRLTSFCHQDLRVLNYEMESSALFGLASMLGHEAVTLCTVIADRTAMEFTSDPTAFIDKLITFTLERLSAVR